MKNYIFILFIFIFNSNLYSQWQEIAPKNMSNILDFQAININTIYLSYRTQMPNAKYYTVRTEDAGQTWDTISKYISNYFFYSKDTGIYLINNNTYRTNDGCKTFSKTTTLYTTAPNANLTKNKFTNNLFLLSRDSGLVKSTDTGKTWKSVLPDYLWGLQFPSPSIGYGYSRSYHNPFTLYKTTDDGDSWQSIKKFNNEIRRIQFPSKNVGYIIRYYGYNGHDSIFKTTDGGNSWFPIMNGINDVQGALGEGLADMYFANENVGWIDFVSSGKNYIYKTTDGGKWWQKLAFDNFSCLLTKFAGFDTNNLILFPAYDCIYRTTNGGGENSSIFETNNSKINKDYTIYPNPTKNTITIECRNKNKITTKVRIYDIQGKLIKEQQLALENTVIDIKDFDKGIYFVKIKDGDGVFVEKVVKN
ncbi:MAG: T9SS type A sorting domain-containing protein [Bacteroidota bacterium]|nr:T9SS type A sorting domain-containing protein [Bacteroidota bacterium]